MEFHIPFSKGLGCLSHFPLNKGYIELDLTSWHLLKKKKTLKTLLMFQLLKSTTKKFKIEYCHFLMIHTELFMDYNLSHQPPRKLKESSVSS